MPRGGMAHYGLLGAAYFPGSSDILEIRVSYTEFPGTSVPWALAARVDDVQEGLPRELGEIVLQTAVRACTEQPRAPGVLWFDRAVHGLVGSAPVVFERLTEALTTIILAGVEDGVSEERLAEILSF